MPKDKITLAPDFNVNLFLILMLIYEIKYTFVILYDSLTSHISKN